MWMHVLLFVLDVCMLREGDGNAGMGDEEGVVGMSVRHLHVGGTCGSGIAQLTC